MNSTCTDTLGMKGSPHVSSLEEARSMAPRIIVSYDDTDNDRDALALGRLLAFSGADLSLAYVRHFPESDPQKEKEERRKAEELLGRGATEIGAPEMARHVVLHASPSAGL